jgi:hypothetical protein
MVRLHHMVVLAMQLHILISSFQRPASESSVYNQNSTQRNNPEDPDLFKYCKCLSIKRIKKPLFFSRRDLKSFVDVSLALN